MRHFRKRVFLALFTIVSLLTLSACGGSSGTSPSPGDTGAGETAKPKPGGTITVAVTSNPVSLDPALMRDWTSRQAIVYLYDTLVYIDENEDIRPRLAESWEASEDGMVYTFKLRKDVTFHDGTPFNAEAVKFNYDRMLDPAFNSKNYATLSSMIDRVEVVDEYTVRFVLKRPDANFLPELSWSSMMVSPSAVKQHGDNFAQHPVGTGPFKFKSFEPDSVLELVRNDAYWGGPPLVDAIRVRIIPERSTQLVELEAGNVDVVYAVPPKDVDRLRNLGINVEIRTTASYAMLALNLAKSPTAELAVRKAIAHAIDRDAIIKQVLYGYAEKSRAGVPSVSPFYNQDVPMIEYDPGLAERLLDDAGWVKRPDGVRHRNGQPLAVKILTSDDEERVLISQVIQQQLSKIGFQAEIETMEWGAYLDAMRAGNYHISYWTLGGFSLQGSDGTANMRSNAYWNVSQIKDAKDLADVSRRIDEIKDKADTTADPVQRREILKEFQQLSQEHQLKVWLWHAQSINAIRPEVKDYDLYNYNIVWLEKAWLNR